MDEIRTHGDQRVCRRWLEKHLAWAGYVPRTWAPVYVGCGRSVLDYHISTGAIRVWSCSREDGRRDGGALVMQLCSMDDLDLLRLSRLKSARKTAKRKKK